MAGAARLPAHRFTKPAFAGSHGAYRRELRRNSARTPDGYGYYASRFGALLDCCPRLAGPESTARPVTRPRLMVLRLFARRGRRAEYPSQQARLSLTVWWPG